MIDGTFEKEFLAVSSRSMLARRWDAAGPRFCAARVPAVTCGRRLWARKGWTPARGVFRALDLASDVFCSLLLL